MFCLLELLLKGGENPSKENIKRFGNPSKYFNENIKDIFVNLSLGVIEIHFRTLTQRSVNYIYIISYTISL